MKIMKKCLSIILIIVVIIQMMACSQKKENLEVNNTEEQNEITNSADESKSVHSVDKNESISFPYIKRHPSSDDYSFLVGKISKLPDAVEGVIDVRSADLSQADLSGELENLLITTYDSKTKWPEKLPKAFNPGKIMEICKDPGLGVRNLHKEGITGKNVGIAIIDQVLLTDHEEYANQLKYYTESDIIDSSSPSEMHGPAVASIAVGKTCGVAPEANLYYIAENFFTKNFTGRVAKDINQLLDLNKTLKESEKIRVISISWGAEEKESEGYAAIKKAYQRAVDEGVFVITTSLMKDGRDGREDIKGINYIGMYRPALSDPNDFSNYSKTSWAKDFYKKDYLCIPMDNRCAASPTGIHDYVKYQSGGLSWSVPYLAGVYALACQVKPDIDYEEFWKIALKTSKSNNELGTIINPQEIINMLK